jgi:mRNA interferase MazF
MMPKPEEIWLVNFPFTDRTSAKVRPALVIASYGSDLIILGVFSKVPIGSLPESSVLIDSEHPDFSQTGLKKTSIVKTNKIATLHESIFQKRLGKIPSDLLIDVKVSLVKTLNL